MIDLTSIIQEINQQLDCEALVRAFSYHPDKIQINGTTLKCFCPVHNELAFRSLIINQKTKTYKCTMKWCGAFAGGSLVELWALVRKVEPVEAAMELVELFHLAVDLQTIRGLSTNWTERAREELEKGEVEAARAAIDQALALDPRNPSLRLFSARVWEAAGQADRALAERLQVFDTRLETEDLVEARRLLDQFMQAQPGCLAFLERNVSLARAEGRPDALRAALLLKADGLAAAGQDASSITALDEAVLLDEADAELLERLARIHLEAGRRAEALDMVQRLVTALEHANDVDRLLRAMQWQAELNPDDHPLSERIANVLDGAGRVGPARDQWLALAERHSAQGRPEEAERIFKLLLSRDPNDVDLLQRQAEMFVRTGDTRRAVAAFRYLAGLAQEVGEITEVGEFFERARRIDPQDPALRRDLAEWRLKTGDLDGGLADLFALAELFLGRGEKDEGAAVLARIAALAPGDLDRRLRIGRCLERNGLADEAAESYCRLVRDFMRQQQPDAALAVCEEVRRLRPGDPATLDLRIEVQLALGRKSDAIEACREAAREALQAGDLDAAEASLARGVKIDRTECHARHDLARLFEKTDRASKAAELWIEAALVARGQEDFSMACDAAREALRLVPDNREARVVLAEGLEAKGQTAEALEIWEKLGAERNEDDPGNHDAYEIYRHALTLAPRRRSLLARVTELALQIEGPQAASDLFRRWLETFDNEPNAAEAIAAYRQAVDAYPDELGWRMHLATMLLESGARQEAAGHLEVLLGVWRGKNAEDGVVLPVLEQLAILQPERLDLRMDLAEGLARQGRAREAAGMFEELGNQCLREGKPGAALPLLERALELRPDLDEALATVARVHEELGDTAQAVAHYERLAEVRRRQTAGASRIQVIEKLLEFQPDRADLRMELADLYEAEGDVDRAVEQRYAIAAAAAVNGDYEAAIALCLRIRAIAPDNAAARELLVECWLKTGRNAEARDELDHLGDAALAAGRLEEAEACFKRIQDLYPDDAGAGERLGKLYEARQLYDQAAVSFRRVLLVYERMCETSRAIGVLRKLRVLQPEDLDIRRELARALLAGGDRHEAAEEWLDLIARSLEKDEIARVEAALSESLGPLAQDWDWRICVVKALTAAGQKVMAAREWLHLAEDALGVREFEIAREAAGEGLAVNPEEIRLREVRIDALCALRSEDAAVADLRDLAERAAALPDMPRAEAYLRRALDLQPRNEQVIDDLAEVLAAGGSIPEACILQRRLIALLQQGGKLDQALRRARRIVELTPGDDEARDMLAALLLDAGRRDEAVEVWRALADRCAEEGSADAAIARYARMLDVKPGDLDLMRRLADLTYDAGGMLEAMGAYDRLIDSLHAAGDAAAIEAEYRRILDLEPGHLQLKERLADFLYEQGRAEEARRTFIEIIAAYRDERSQLDDALRVMRHLKALDPDDTAGREEEAMLLEASGRAAEAAQVWRQLAAAYRRAGDGSACARCLARAADQETDNPDLQVETARLHGMQNDRDRAIEYYLRAVEIHDRNDRPEACVPVLREAFRLDPSRLDLPAALAQILERLGQTAEALAEWLALGEAHEAAGSIAAARRIYEHVRALLPEEMESRRRLARIAEAEGDRSVAVRELHELAASAIRTDNPLEAAACLRRILALNPADETAMLELAEAWRRLEKKAELFETVSMLERYYSSMGRESEALTMLAELKALRPEEPELTGRAIELLIKTGRAAEAARQGVELIQIYFDRGDDSHALETLRRIAEIEPGNIERRISLARLVHTNHREAAAIQEFYLTATKLFGESNWEACLAVCTAGLQLCPDELRLRDLQGRTLARLGRHADSIGVQLQMAALYDARGEDARARRIYETLLEEQPDHPETLEAMVEWAVRHGRPGAAVDHLLRLAESHYVNGRLAESIAAMERIQSLDPTRLEVRARLAETYLESGDQAAAVRTWMATAAGMVEVGRHEPAIEIYERILLLRPDDVAVMAALAPVYRAAGRTEAHEKLAARLGEIYLAQDRTGEALELFEEISRRYPGDLTSWERLAGLYQSLGRIDEAVEAHRHLYEIHRTQRRLDQARRALEAALALRPGDAEMLESLGDLCLALSRRPEGIAWLAQAARAHFTNAEGGMLNEGLRRARDLAQRVLKLDPLNLDVRRLHGETQEALGERKDAIEEFTQAARGYADVYQNDAALEVLTRLLTLDPARADDRELYARILHRTGRVDESVAQYILLLESVGPNEDPRRSIKYCRQILAERPDNPAAHASLCAIHERADKLRQALQECEWLADYYLQRQAWPQAEEFVRKGLGWFPEDLAMRTRQVDLLIGLERRPEAGQELAAIASAAEARADVAMTEWAMTRACTIEPENLDHRARLADYQERTGNTAGARATRLELIRLMIEAGRAGEARELAARLVASAAEDLDLRLELATLLETCGLTDAAASHFHALARRALTDNNCEDAKTLARRALALEPRLTAAAETLIEALRAKRELNEAIAECERLHALFDSAGDCDGALRAMQTLIDMVPSSPEPRRRLVQLYRKLKREDAMVEQLRRLAELYVNSDDVVGAIESLRELLDVRPDDTQARTRYIDLYTQLGDEGALQEDYMQLARSCVRKGRLVEATRAYEKVIEIMPDDPDPHEEFVTFLFEQGQVHRGVEETRPLAELYERLGRTQDAGRVLDRALNYAPQDLDLRQRLASVHLRAGRRGLALEAFRGLARQYEHLGDEARLLEVIRKIVEIDELNVEFRQRLADLLERNGQTEEAYAEFKHLAQHYEERGLLDLAEHQWRRILAIHPEDIDALTAVTELHMRSGSSADMLPELKRLADHYAAQGRIRDTIRLYRTIMQHEPENTEMLGCYLESYMQFGLEQDLVEDYLRLADLKAKKGEVEEAARIYKRILEVQPNNLDATRRLDETQRRINGNMGSGTAAPAPASAQNPNANTKRPGETRNQASNANTHTKRHPGETRVRKAKAKAAPQPAGDPDTPSLEKVIRNYENILMLSPSNPSVRAKLAELLEQAGRADRAENEWVLAGDAYMAKGEITRGIEIYERCLAKKPADTSLRERLARARVQLDSMRAIDGVFKNF